MQKRILLCDLNLYVCVNAVPRVYIYIYICIYVYKYTRQIIIFRAQWHNTSFWHVKTILPNRKNFSNRLLRISGISAYHCRMMRDCYKSHHLATYNRYCIIYRFFSMTHLYEITEEKSGIIISLTVQTVSRARFTIIAFASLIVKFPSDIFLTDDVIHQMCMSRAKVHTRSLFYIQLQLT